MKLRIITKKSVVDSAIQFPRKSILGLWSSQRPPANRFQRIYANTFVCFFLISSLILFFLSYQRMSQNFFIKWPEMRVVFVNFLPQGAFYIGGGTFGGCVGVKLGFVFGWFEEIRAFCDALSPTRDENSISRTTPSTTKPPNYIFIS